MRTCIIATIVYCICLGVRLVYLLCARRAGGAAVYEVGGEDKPRNRAEHVMVE